MWPGSIIQGAHAQGAHFIGMEKGAGDFCGRSPIRRNSFSVDPGERVTLSRRSNQITWHIGHTSICTSVPRRAHNVSDVVAAAQDGQRIRVGDS